MIKTLKDFPNKRDETIKLIEKSFDYSKDNSFEIDFYPLMNEKNANNNYILLEENKVIGHIGVNYKELKIMDVNFSIAMLGGIAIEESCRGKGYFRPFIENVLQSITDSPFILLWSDKIDLYERFSFYPCIEQFEYSGVPEEENPNYICRKLKDLSTLEVNQLKSIYDSSTELRFKRSLEEWKELSNIVSSDIYIKKVDGKIQNYFFMNKGEDLNDIIYEYGNIDDVEEISSYGILWSPWSFEVENEDFKSLLFAALIRINNFQSFKQFIGKYTDNLIQVLEINDQEITFTFEDKKMTLSVSEFVQGILGPNKFTELLDTKKILISGLDSI